MDNIREELELHETVKHGKYKVHAHTIHSIRGSFITHMAPKRFEETLVNYIVGHKLSGINEKHYKRYDSEPELYTRDIIETMESLVDARHAFDVALYGEKHACGLLMEGDSIDDMPDGWEEYLLQSKRWTEEGIAYLRFKSVQGSPPSVIKGLISSLNKFRVELGARWVDAALVEKYTGQPYVGMPDMNDPRMREALATETGITLPKNCIRHTAASFMAESQGYTETANQLGHDISMQLKHYRRAITKSEAEDYYNITPDSVCG